MDLARAGVICGKVKVKGDSGLVKAPGTRGEYTERELLYRENYRDATNTSYLST